MIFFLFSFFSCINARRNTNEIIEESFQLVIYNTAKNALFCTFPIEKSNQDDICKLSSSYRKKDVRCVEFFPETEIASNSRESVDLILKGLSSIELMDKSLKSNIKNVSHVSSGYYNLFKPSESSKIIKDIETSIKSEGYSVNSKQISPEDEIKFQYKSFGDNQIKAYGVLNFSPDSISLAYQPDTKTEQEKNLVIRQGIDTFQKEFSDSKDEYKSCRQPISNFFKTETSSFDNCKENIIKNLKKSILFKNIFDLKINNSIPYFSTGSIWEYYLPEKKEVKNLELVEIGKQFCKLTIAEILNKGIKKKDAQNLCYTLAFQSAIIDSIGILNLKIERRESFIRNMSVSKIFFPDYCK